MEVDPLDVKPLDNIDESDQEEGFFTPTNTIIVAGVAATAAGTAIGISYLLKARKSKLKLKKSARKKLDNNNNSDSEHDHPSDSDDEYTFEKPNCISEEKFTN